MNLENIETRAALAKAAYEHMQSGTEAKRSIKENKIYKGKLKHYVREYLIDQLGEDTVKKMPVVYSVNMCKRIIDKEASIYRNEPDRKFSGSDDQNKAIHEIYGALKTKQKLTRANRIFKNSGQAFLQVIHNIEKKKLEIRILKKHQCYAVGKTLRPTEIEVFVVIGGDTSDQSKTIFSVWSNGFNFIMDINGAILSTKDGAPDMVNPLGIIPVIDISDEDEKENSVFVHHDHSLINFTIQINAALSDLFYIMRCQGYAVPLIKGPMSVLNALQSVTIGPNRVLKLPTNIEDGEGKQSAVSFDFVSANPDLSASIETISTLLSAFLTSRNVDPKTINFKGDGKSFASGWERFLALVESFEASQDDIGIFQDVENQLFEIVKKYHDAWSNDPEKLEKKYTSSNLGGASVSVIFSGPEMIETRSDKLERLYKEKTYGLISQIDFIAQYKGVSKEEAKKIYEQIKTDEGNSEPLEA